MYELVNTSVPNGLIAGTRGFATVAMTKGMPDAIRSRVESFCAYPHRTSAHDESYFRENPVNWFHLQIAGGDHVVGRTAPADFDYTGRTNRIAHTLVFCAKEMPIVGGAYVLGAESRRFVAAWSGDPKYLAVDKLTAGRLGLADIPKNTTPTNWTATFGDDGAKYARRFAALVAKNVSGGNKCVYFKTSTAWDGDGTRLLGLFSDLINLLPEGIRPFVTFSTFAACVPNGVACHLRGIYDKDRAFETASATQSWVDCEHGRIVHEELLPEEGSVRSGMEVNNEANGHTHLTDPRYVNVMAPSENRAGGMNAHGTRSKRKIMVPCFIIIVVAVVAAVAGLLFKDEIIRWWHKSPSDNRLLEMAQKEKLREEEMARVAVAQERQRKEQELLEAEQKRKEDENMRHVEDEQKKQKEEAERRKRLEQDNESARQAEIDVAKAKERQKAEAAVEKKAMADERAQWPRKIDAENVLFDKTLDDIVLEDGGMKFKRDYAGLPLTNAESIVIHWRERDGSLRCRVTAYEERSKSDPMRQGRKTTSYRIKDDAGRDSSWVMYRLILGPWDKNLKRFSKERVFWLWRREKETDAVFQEKGTLDIQKTFFGGDEKLYALWSQIKVPKCFKYGFAPTSGVSDELVAWLRNRYYVGDCWAIVKEDIVKLVLRKENEKLQRLQKDLDNADKEKACCDRECQDAQEDVKKAEAKNEEMKKTKKDEKGFGNKPKKATLWEEIEKILRPYFKSGTEFKTANFASYIQEVKSKTECHHPYKHDKERLEKAKVAKENEIKELEEALKNMALQVGVLDGSYSEGNGIKKRLDVVSDND